MGSTLLLMLYFCIYFSSDTKLWLWFNWEFIGTQTLTGFTGKMCEGKQKPYKIIKILSRSVIHKSHMSPLVLRAIITSNSGNSKLHLYEILYFFCASFFCSFLHQNIIGTAVIYHTHLKETKSQGKQNCSWILFGRVVPRCITTIGCSNVAPCLIRRKMRISMAGLKKCLTNVEITPWGTLYDYNKTILFSFISFLTFSRSLSTRAYFHRWVYIGCGGEYWRNIIRFGCGKRNTCPTIRRIQL